MREIKFRSWDKQSKRMRNIYSLAFDSEGSIKIVNAWGYNVIEDKEVIVRREKQYTLLQYAGLKDKNGVEIYEGDVLGKRGHWSYYIGFKDACFVMIPCNSIQRVNWTWHPVGQKIIDGWEVIGNIYENPELLEAAE